MAAAPKGWSRYQEFFMRKMFAIAMLSLAGLAGPVHAQTAATPAPAAAPPVVNSQQNKMADCNKQATGKKGDDRKSFMSSCLSAPKKMTQQEKMTACNKQATGKKGDDRKSFMSQCLRAG